MIFSGPLDRRIAIQRPVSAPDAVGQGITSWATVTTVWASYMPVKDRERFASNAGEASLTARFQIRYSAAMAMVDERHRLLFDSREFEIVGVKEMGRKEGLEISATARSERV